MKRPMQWLGSSRRLEIVSRGNGSVSRSRRSRRGILVEALEDRSLLSTLDISGGVLSYSASSGSASALTIAVDPVNTADIILTDPNQSTTIGLGAALAGWSYDAIAHQAIGPASSFTSVSVSGATTSGQSLAIDFTTGDPLTSGGLTFTPTAATGGASNGMTLTPGGGTAAFLSESYTPGLPGAGTLSYTDANSVIVPLTFSNLSPIFNIVPSPTFIFTAPTGATTVNVVDGPAGTTQINAGTTGAFELINFANKAAVTVNVPIAGATTTVDTTTASAGLTQLFVNSGAGGDTVDVQATPIGVTTTTDTGSVSGSSTVVGNANRLSSIFGPVVVQSTGGTNAATVNDSAATAAETYTLDNSVITASSMPSQITLGTGITTLSLNSSGGSTVNLDALTQGSVNTYNFTGGTVLGLSTLNIHSNQTTLSYGTAGTLTFGAGQPTVNYTNFATANVSKPATAPTGTSTTITGTEGQALNGVVVATFTSPDLADTNSGFVATIDWGDGTTTAGTISPTAVGTYQVTGSHTYAAGGTFPVNVTLVDQGTSGSATVGGTTINVTSNGPVNGTPSPIASSANIAVAPITAQGATIRGIEGYTLAGQGFVPPPIGATLQIGPVATFMDTGTPAAASAYTATIDWGDGTSSSGTISSQGTANGIVYSVAGMHLYAETGTYALTVTITKTASGSTAIASGQAVVADAPLVPASPQPTVSTTEGTVFSGPVGSFVDGNTAAPATDYTYVMIAWGDGTPQTPGTVVATSTPGVFTVDGTHTYADAGVNGGIGHYPITINVHGIDGATTTITNTANVADVVLTVSGKLNPSSDSGISNTDNITNVVQPNFIGSTSQPNATITLYAQAAGGSPVPIGYGVSDAAGAWSITSQIPLNDGAYTITAVAVDSSGHTVSGTTTIVSNLVIDTAGPKVTSVAFKRFQGQIVVTYQDFGGPGNAGVGLVSAGVVDASSYQLVTVHHPRVGKYRINVISDTPATATGTQTVTLSVNRGHYIRGGWYFFTIQSASALNASGVRDVAGNALDGEFYGYYPSGNNVPGGNFVAQLTAIHHTIYAPSTVFGRATPVNPPGTRQVTIYDPTTVNPSKFPRVALAAQRSRALLAAVRRVNHTALAASSPIRSGFRPLIAGAAPGSAGSQPTQLGALGALTQSDPTNRHRKA